MSAIESYICSLCGSEVKRSEHGFFEHAGRAFDQEDSDRCIDILIATKDAEIARLRADLKHAMDDAERSAKRVRELEDIVDKSL